MQVPSLDVLSYVAEQEFGVPLFLLDVREPKEAAICTIEGSVLIPLNQLPERIHELPRDQRIVVHCHHGGRSAKAVQFLLDHGFTDVRNLSGGIEAWSLQVDPATPRY